ncbi:hypothetical protein PGB90_000866 [Kerria lacca]
MEFSCGYIQLIPLYDHSQRVIYDPLKIRSIDGTHIEPHDKGIIRDLNANYQLNYKAKRIPENTVFIARLSRRITDAKIIRCHLIKDIIANFSLQYASIEYENKSSAKLVVKKGDKTILDEKIILVYFECEYPFPGWVPRRLVVVLESNNKIQITDEEEFRWISAYTPILGTLPAGMIADTFGRKLYGSFSPFYGREFGY